MVLYSLDWHPLDWYFMGAWKGDIDIYLFILLIESQKWGMSRRWDGNVDITRSKGTIETVLNTILVDVLLLEPDLPLSL